MARRVLRRAWWRQFAVLAALGAPAATLRRRRLIIGRRRSPTTSRGRRVQCSLREAIKSRRTPTSATRKRLQWPVRAANSTQITVERGRHHPAHPQPARGHDESCLRSRPAATSSSSTVMDSLARRSGHRRHADALRHRRSSNGRDVPGVGRSGVRSPTARHVPRRQPRRSPIERRDLRRRRPQQRHDAVHADPRATGNTATEGGWRRDLQRGLDHRSRTSRSPGNRADERRWRHLPAIGEATLTKHLTVVGNTAPRRRVASTQVGGLAVRDQLDRHRQHAARETSGQHGRDATTSSRVS